MGTKHQPYLSSFSLGRGCNFFLFPNLLLSIHPPTLRYYAKKHKRFFNCSLTVVKRTAIQYCRTQLIFVPTLLTLKVLKQWTVRLNPYSGSICSLSSKQEEREAGIISSKKLCPESRVLLDNFLYWVFSFFSPPQVKSIHEKEYNLNTEGEPFFKKSSQKNSLLSNADHKL